MTSITAILSRSTSPPLSQRPCPGARTKLVALPNLSVNSLQEFFEAGLRYGWPLPDLVGRRICTRCDAGLMTPCAPALLPASFQGAYPS